MTEKLTRTPDIRSPYNLLQEQYQDDPWKVLIVCMLLNITSAKQVKQIIEKFFTLWPTPKSLLDDESDALIDLIKPLGLYNRRSKSIRRMTREYVEGSFKDPINLTGIGKYASDSYKIFVERQLITDVEDKELKNYVRWALSLEEKTRK